ncbi:MAG: hypothetical protein ACM3SP_03270 [Chloroflexota bacterium]
MRFGETQRTLLCRDRLLRRRKVAAEILTSLTAERKLVDGNGGWQYSNERRRRKHLFDEIHDWYDQELKKIDAALDRLNRNSHCVAK